MIDPPNGWDGKAELAYKPDGHRDPHRGRGALTKLQIYDAWDYPYICVEPVSNANDGFNRMARNVPGHNVHVLEAWPNRFPWLDTVPLRSLTLSLSVLPGRIIPVREHSPFLEPVA